MKTLIFTLFFTVLILFSASAQDLPHRLTAKEKALMPAYLENIQSKGITSPPGFEVRTAAEWEEMQGVIISWQSYTSALTEIVRHAVQECRVYIVTQNQSSVQNTLTNAGIALDSVSFLNEPSNSVWIRDYAAFGVYADQVGELYFVDWIYNRPRPYDDVIPAALASEMGVTLYQTTTSPYDLVATGGNFMTDGFGTAFSSELILEENQSHTEAEIDNIVNQFMGIERYIKMETLPYDAIHHIDMHIKLLDEETLLVGEYPHGVADGPQIEQNLAYVLNNFNSVFGTRYRVVRIPMPDDNGYYPDNYGDYYTYTNSLILNKTVLVPVYGISEDQEALEIYRQAMPGYKVVGINSSASIQALGAIHCITHEIAAHNPLLISHHRLRDHTQSQPEGYPIEAKIMHHSGIQQASIWFSTDTASGYSSVSMTLTDTTENLWSAHIPKVSGQDTVFYYIQAQALSGKTQVRPMTAPQGYWKFAVDEATNLAQAQNQSQTALFPLHDAQNQQLKIFVQSHQRQTGTLMLFNLLGQPIGESFQGEIPATGKTLFFNTSGFSPGIYILRWQSKNQLLSKKILIQ